MSKFLDSNGVLFLWNKITALVNGKQDTITDLDTIRSGAAKGATAVQDVSGKQDKSTLEADVAAKGFTKNAVKSVNSKTGTTITLEAQDIKIRDSAQTAYNKYTLESAISDIDERIGDLEDAGYITSADISGKQDKSTLEADVLAKGFTKNAVTSVNSKTGAVTLNANEVSLRTSAQTVYNKSTVEGAIVDIDDRIDNLESAGYITSTDIDTRISGKQDVSTLEADVAAKGFTKNAVTSVNGNTGMVTIKAGDINLNNAAQTIYNKSTVEGAIVGLDDRLDALESAGYITSANVDTKINTALTSAVIYKGSKTNMTALNNIATSNRKIGDMWNVSADGMNYVWNGTEWDAQAPMIVVEALNNTEIQNILDGQTVS